MLSTLLAEDKIMTDLSATCKEDVVCKKVLQHSYLKVFEVARKFRVLVGGHVGGMSF